jgi:dTDP-4-dehydrorhamnose reductase
VVHTSGYTNHLWNGVTTLQFAELCGKIMEMDKFDVLRKESAVFHFVPNRPVTKYELLTIFSRVLDKKVDIIPTEDQFTVKRMLTTKYDSLKEIFGSDKDIETTVRRCYEYAELSGLR